MRHNEMELCDCIGRLHGYSTTPAGHRLTRCSACGVELVVTLGDVARVTVERMTAAVKQQQPSDQQGEGSEEGRS